MRYVYIFNEDSWAIFPRGLPSLAGCLMSLLCEECDVGAIDVTCIHSCDPGQV